MPAGPGTPLLAPGGNGTPGLADVKEWQRASDFVSLYSTMQQDYNAGSGLAGATTPAGADKFLTWQSGVAKAQTIGSLAAVFSSGASLDLGYQPPGSYLSAPIPNVTASGSYAIGATSSDVRIAKATTGTLDVQLGDGSAGARLRVVDSPSTSLPSIVGTGSATNGLGFLGGIVLIQQGGNRRAAFSSGLELAGADVFSWTAGTDAYAGAMDTQISRPAAGTASLDTTTTGDGLALLKLGGIRLLGFTSTTTNATTTQLPNAKDLAVHKNTTTGFVYLAFNDGGTVRAVQMT